MQITKYIHSCVLLEDQGTQILFDPGTFTFVEELVSPTLFRDVSAIVLTHAHPDHMDARAVRQIADVSGAAVIGNSDVAMKLRPESVDVTVVEDGEHQAGPFHLRAFPAKHERILGSEAPPNKAFLVNGQLLNPGDSFDERLLEHKGVELLLLPVLGPYMTEIMMFDFLQKMAPQSVVPVHDGYAKPFFHKLRYAVYEELMGKMNVKFHWLAQPGDRVVI